MTFLWLSQDFLRTFWVLSEDFRRTLRTVWGLLEDLLRTFCGISDDFHRTFWGFSEDLLRTSQDFLRTLSGLYQVYNWIFKVNSKSLALIALPCFILTSTYLSLYILPLTYYLLKKVVSAIPVVFLKIYLKYNQNFFHDVPDHLNDHKVA